MWYTEGTVAVTNGGTNITGTGTSFLTNARVGDGITITGSTALHEIIGVTSNTQLSIRPAYAGTTGSGRSYGISPLLGYDKDLSDAFNQLRLQFGDQLSNLQPWATANTVAEAREELGVENLSSRSVTTNTGTQTVAEALDSRMPVFNVRQYGAMGNGSNNDSNALQSAHDAALSAGGGIVYLPPGTYPVQGVVFHPTVHWSGAGHQATKVKAIENPVEGIGLFQIADNLAQITDLSFSSMSINGDGISSSYIPSGATVPGIDFGTNLVDAEINQVYFDKLFIAFCTVGINLIRSVRYCPITNCRFWYNDVGLYVGNEHPILNNCEFRYNDVGLSGTIQDMDITNTRFAYNRVGSNAMISRSGFTNVKVWQNREVGIDNLLEYNHFSSCIFRGAGSFWEGITGEENKSVGIGWYSRSSTITSSLFWGGNGGAMIELKSGNPQNGGGISNSTIIVSDGHFLEKVGSGSYSGFSISDNSFLINSIGDSEGAMLVRVPNNVSGGFAYFQMKDNYIRHESVTQIFDLVQIDQSFTGGHDFSGNTFHAQSGVCGGINVYDNASSKYRGNTFRGGSFLNKIFVRSPQAGMVIRDNPGFSTEGSGEYQFSQGEVSVDIPHGLDQRPSGACFTVCFANSGGNAQKVWVDRFNINNETFRVEIDQDPGIDGARVFWQVNAIRFI